MPEATDPPVVPTIVARPETCERRDGVYRGLRTLRDNFVIAADWQRIGEGTISSESFFPTTFEILPKVPLYLIDFGDLQATKEINLLSIETSGGYFRDALQNLGLAVGNANRLSQIASSARSVFQHVVTDESIVLDRDQIDALVEEQSGRLHEIARERANIEEFQRYLRAFYGDPKAIERDHATASGHARRVQPGHWVRVRGELQDWFAVGLKSLSELTHVARGTLLALSQSDHELRGPTVRKLHAVHASARSIVEIEGDRGLTWLRGPGAELLRRAGLGAFEEAVDERLLKERLIDRVDSVSIEGDPLARTRPKESAPPYAGLKGRF